MKKHKYNFSFDTLPMKKYITHNQNPENPCFFIHNELYGNIAKTVVTINFKNDIHQ